jgi:hypothetical protein
MAGMEHPKGLAPTTALMCICNAMGWSIIEWDKPHAWALFVSFTILILIGYVVLWFYWKGRNWARMAVLLTSALTLYNLRYVLRGNVFHHVMTVSEASLGIFLLYWLNTTPVRAYFKAKPRIPDSVAGA